MFFTKALFGFKQTCQAYSIGPRGQSALALMMSFRTLVMTFYTYPELTSE
jgi:hypothetical protein